MSTARPILSPDLLTRASAFTGSMADLAQLYVGAGVPVLPCHPERKHPLIKGGFHKRSADPEVVARWWKQWPGALVGLVPADVGLIALDIDSTDAATAARAAGLLNNPALIVETGGTSKPFEIDRQTVSPLHVYVPANGTVPKADGLVVRYGKGYVIAPGSRRPNGRGWRVSETGLGEWANQNSVPELSPPTPGVPDSGNTGSREVDLRAPDLDRVRAAVAVIPNPLETSRDEYVRMAHMIRAAVGDEEEAGLAIFRDWAAKWPGPVNGAEDERVYRTIQPANIHAGWPTLHRLAAEYGFDNRDDVQREAQVDFTADPEARPDEQPELRPDEGPTLHARLLVLREELRAIGDPLERDAVRAQWVGALAYDLHIPFTVVRERLDAFDAPHREPVLSVRPGCAMFKPLVTDPVRPLVAGYLYPNQQHVVFGEPASFKTFIALDLALSVASGRKWLGTIPVTQTGVVFFAGEASETVRVRIAAWCAARGLSPDDIKRLPFTLVNAVPTFGRGEDGLNDAIRRVREAEQGTGEPVGLVVFDNMTRMLAAAGLSNTDTGEYGRVFGDLDRFVHDTRAATLTIYHSPVSDAKRPAGTYQSTANPDVVLSVVRHKNEDDDDAQLTAILRTTKSRAARPAPAIQLRLREQDVRPFLRAMFPAAGLPVPDPLSELREHEASLVVDGSESIADVKEQDLDRRVLNALTQGPLSGNRLRKELGGKHENIDRALGRLVADKLVDRKNGPRGAQVYSLTNAGRQQASDLSDLTHNGARDGAAGREPA